MQFTLGRLSICAGKNRSLMVTDIAKAFMPPAASKSEIASRRTGREVDSALRYNSSDLKHLHLPHCIVEMQIDRTANSPLI